MLSFKLVSNKSLMKLHVCDIVLPAVWFDSLRSSQQFFCYVRTGLPWLNQYQARINVSCSMTQRSDAGEAQTLNPSISREALYHWATALQHFYIVV